MTDPTAYFLCDAGGDAEKVILDYHDAANAWRAAAHKIAADAFGRDTSPLRISVGSRFWVALLEGEGIPKGWQAERVIREPQAPHGLAFLKAPGMRRLPRVPDRYELGPLLFQQDLLGSPVVPGNTWKVYFPGWEKLCGRWVVMVTDYRGGVPTPTGSRRLKEYQYWLLKECHAADPEHGFEIYAYAMFALGGANPIFRAKAS